MLPGNTSSTLVGNFIRAQQGVIDTVRISPDDLRLTVGEKVQAVVTNQLNNGRFAVLVKDQLLDLNLPRNTQPGQEFELTVLSKEPQLTFRLNTAAQSALAGGLPAAQADSDTPVALSKGANMIGELLKQESKSASSSVLQQTQPLFTAKPDTVQLAGQLASRLSASGLFYESHQAEWVSGGRAFQTLLSEPQALFKPETMTQPESREKSGQPVVPARVAEQPEGKSQPSEIQDKALRSVLDASNTLRTQNTLADDKALQQMVRQQLDLVENKPLVWQGQAWPGQNLHWELELENEREAQQADAATSQQWQTRLNLDLPKLGALGVVAQLQQGQFRLRFQAASETTAQTLREQQAELMRRFEAAGLQLVGTQVEHDEH
ncbi:flagellar hook-length control protein FliK [Chitinibacter sp. GC72]|uniref:flagellar hook-length control protein FliK n=1 Tax=Chitinibacter sp. GC72 TaxID=1526917 RepID=UPI0012FB2D72|nr:flagellar hook-length control protein FliK [Chitinibacter sp. GC72]